MGRRWFDLISRFGNSVLLLIPAENTKYRQASWRSLILSSTVYLANLQARIRKLSVREFSRLLNILEQSRNFQVLLKTAHQMFQSVHLQSA